METTEEYAFTQTPLSASPQTPRYNTRNCPSSRIRSRSWSPVRLFSPRDTLHGGIKPHLLSDHVHRQIALSGDDHQPRFLQRIRKPVITVQTKTLGYFSENLAMASENSPPW